VGKGSVKRARFDGTDLVVELGKALEPAAEKAEKPAAPTPKKKK
jgi:hypothetical protein